MLCLEVKGGTLVHRDGDWFQNERRMKQSPFAQAGGGASALYEYLSGRVSSSASFVRRARRRLPGVAVRSRSAVRRCATMVFDDSRSRSSDVGVRRPSGRVLEARDRDAARSSAGWPRPRCALVDRPRACSRLRACALAARASSRGRRGADPPDGAAEGALRGLVETPRVVVRGGAGTGKTLIACDEAVRLAEDRPRTLFVCYGSRLASHVRPLLEPAGVRVVHLHGLMRELIEEAGLQDRLPPVEPRDLFDVHYPEVALDALRNARPVRVRRRARDRRGAGSAEAAVRALSRRLLRASSTDGTWRLFHDPNQDIFRGGPLGGARAAGERRHLLPPHAELSQYARDRDGDVDPVWGRRLGDARCRGPGRERGLVHRSRSHEKAVLQATAGVARRRRRGPDDITVSRPGSFEGSALAMIELSRLPRPIVDVSHAESDDANRSGSRRWPASRASSRKRFF